MADYDYAPLRARVLALVDRYGRSVVVYKTATTAADPAKPWRGPSNATPEATVTAKAVVDENASKDVEGTLVRRGDAVAYVAAAAATQDLTTFDRLSDGGALRSVTSVELIGPGGTGLLYVMRLQR